MVYLGENSMISPSGKVLVSGCTLARINCERTGIGSGRRWSWFCWPTLDHKTWFTLQQPIMKCEHGPLTRLGNNISTGRSLPTTQLMQFPSMGSITVGLKSWHMVSAYFFSLKRIGFYADSFTRSLEWPVRERQRQRVIYWFLLRLYSIQDSTPLGEGAYRE